MKAMNFGYQHPALEQLHSNKSLWVGHMGASSTDHFAGQTFQCPDEGKLNKIQVYSMAVPHPGKVILTLHEFDRKAKKWGPALTSSEIKVDSNDEENWMQFPIHSVPLHRGNTYGFQLKSPDGLVAIGEAAWTNKHSFNYGEEWSVNNIENKDHYYRYFSLAFKVQLRA